MAKVLRERTDERRWIINLTDVQPLRVYFTIHNEFHWSLDLLGDRLNYWPSTNKWRWRNETHRGSVSMLQEFIGTHIQEALDQGIIKDASDACSKPKAKLSRGSSEPVTTNAGLRLDNGETDEPPF